MLLGSLQLQVRANRHVFGSNDPTADTGTSDGEGAAPLISPVEVLPKYELGDVRIESKALLPAYIQNLWKEMKASFDALSPEETPARKALTTFLKAMQKAVGSVASDDFPETLPPVENSIDANEAVEQIFSAIKELVASLPTEVPSSPDRPVAPTIPGTTPPSLTLVTTAVRKFREQFKMTSSILFTDENVDVLDKLRGGTLPGVGIRASVKNGELLYAFIKDNKVEGRDQSTGPVVQKIAADLQAKFETDPKPPLLQIRMRDERVTMESTPTVSAKGTEETVAAFAERVVNTLIKNWEEQHLSHVKRTVQLVNELPTLTEKDYSGKVERARKFNQGRRSASPSRQASADNDLNSPPKTAETSRTRDADDDNLLSA